MRIAGRTIGAGEPPYVIAELGVNHDGSLERAIELVRLAADAGADAVKFQFFRADLLMSRGSRLAAYQANAGERDPHAMLRRLELSIDALGACVREAKARGVHAIVTVFSDSLVPLADTLAWDAYKTASPDIVHKPLLTALEQTGKPMIVSTGASTIDEVARALGWLAPARGRLALLQCVSSYPTPSELAAIGAMGALARRFDGPVGYSDHTRGVDAARVAIAHGATILEKHVTWNTQATGPDHAASLDADGLRAYVQLALATWEQRRQGILAPATPQDGAMLGSPEKVVLACEQDVRGVSRQSLVAARALPAGHTLGTGDLVIKRPGTGIPAFALEETLGRVTRRAVEADMPLVLEDLAAAIPASR